MWKQFGRGVRETIEKRTNFPSRDNKKSQSNHTECYYYYLLQKNLCSFTSLLHCDKSKENVFEVNNCKHKYYHHNHHHQRKQGDKNKSTTHVFGDVNQRPGSFVEALTGSSILVLGWYITQPFWWKKEKYHTNPEIVNNTKQLEQQNNRYIHLSSLLTKLAFAHPNIVNVKSNEPKKLTAYTESGKVYGPLSPEETIDEAALKFQEVHNKALAIAENKSGVNCMKENKIDEAKGHFERAVNLKSIPALFNLGLVHEIQRNISEAVHYYLKASEYGHPGAKYNLGVFYAHGIGGLKQDKKRAVKFFEEAAALGQQNAFDALRTVEPFSHSAIISKKTNKILQDIGIHEPVTRSDKPSNVLVLI